MALSTLSCSVAESHTAMVYHLLTSLWQALAYHQRAMQQETVSDDYRVILPLPQLSTVLLVGTLKYQQRR